MTFSGTFFSTNVVYIDLAPCTENARQFEPLIYLRRDKGGFVVTGAGEGAKTRSAFVLPVAFILLTKEI